jgi:IS30 family transposase
MKKVSKRKQMKKIRSHRKLEWLVRKLLLEWRSAEKVSLRIQREYHISLSGSTIRRYIDSKFARDLKMTLLEKKLLKQYRQRNIAKTTWKIPYRVDIDARPLFISTPMSPGHYECDFIVSSKLDKTVFLTLVDKFSRLKIALKLPHKEARLVENVLKQLILQYWIKTISFDNDLSFARHYMLWIHTYFSHPYHAREKWQIENANKWRRRFFPKWTILKNISQHDLNNATHYLNHDPMKCFAGRTPREVHFNTSIRYLPIIL